MFRLSMIALLCCAAMSAVAQAIDRGEQSVGASGLPLPRFVSLASGEAHMRTGPGQQYPILWTYQRRGLPLLITAEYGNWRKVEDMDGAAGWMHSALLSGTRMAVMTGGLRSLYAKPADGAPEIFRAEPGVVVELLACHDGWCRAGLLGRKAWVRAQDVWGVFDGEAFD